MKFLADQEEDIPASNPLPAQAQATQVPQVE